MVKLAGVKRNLGAILTLISIGFIASNTNAADIAKGASVAKNASHAVRISHVRPSTVSKGIVASIISNGRGSSNLEIKPSTETSSNKQNTSTQSALTLCGGQLIDEPCTGGRFLPGRFLPPTATTTTTTTKP